MNWWNEYKMIDEFYTIAVKIVNNIKFATSPSPSGRYKLKDLKRWGLLHFMLAKELNIDPSDPDYIDNFITISDIFRGLTDKLGHLPNRNDFMAAWKSWNNYPNLNNELPKH